jgi:gluconate 5-dehydrogenase/3-oxoacyl-[acyl-carrier protein] reductase
MVAGAAGRLGTALSDACAAQGAHLVLHSRNPTADRAAELSRKYGNRTVCFTADITSEREMSELPDRLADLGVDRLDAVVNCVTAFDGRPRPVAELDAATFRHVVDVDLVGSYVLARAAQPLLGKADQPRLVFISSLAGLRGRVGAAQLCAAKAGVVGLTLALARDFAGTRILVNTVAPGPLLPPEGVEHAPLPKGLSFSAPEDVVSSVLFLASPLNRAMTGQSLVVNGKEP